MYTCNDHGWTSFERPCPTCNPMTVTSASGTTTPIEQSPSGANVLVEALKYLIKDIKRKPNDTRYATAIKKAEDALAQYNAVEPELWKSVEKDGYPEYNRGLIVCIPDEDYHITSGMWDRDNKWVLLDDYRVPDCPVTHYMPLPPFPKQFQNEISENDAVMEHLAKLLKMGKIKKPETLPSKSHPTPIDREPEQGTVIGTIAYNPASGDLRVTPDPEPEGIDGMGNDPL